MKFLLVDSQRVRCYYFISLYNDIAKQSADYLRSTTYPELPGHKFEVMLLYYTILQKFADGGAEFQVSALNDCFGDF